MKENQLRHLSHVGLPALTHLDMGGSPCRCVTCDRSSSFRLLVRGVKYHWLGQIKVTKIYWNNLPRDLTFAIKKNPFKSGRVCVSMVFLCVSSVTSSNCLTLFVTFRKRQICIKRRLTKVPHPSQERLSMSSISSGILHYLTIELSMKRCVWVFL